MLAWYSLVHTTTAEMPEVLASLVRPLRPGGWLVYGGHAGTGVVHRDDWWDQTVDLDFVLQEPTDVAALFERAGLVDVDVVPPRAGRPTAASRPSGPTCSGARQAERTSSPVVAA